MKAKKLGRRPSERNLVPPPKPPVRRPKPAQSPSSADLRPIPHRIRDLVAEAAHRAVCEVGGDDGMGKCLMYAIAGYALLHRQGFHVNAGSLVLLVDPTVAPDGTVGQVMMDARNNGFGRGEYHAWLGRQVGNRVEIVDLASRHYKRYADEVMNVSEARTLPGGGSIYILADRDKRVRWTRDEPPTSVWTSNGHAEGLAQYLGDEAATYEVWQAMMTDPQTQMLWAAARRHFDSLVKEQKP